MSKTVGVGKSVQGYRITDGMPNAADTRMGELKRQQEKERVFSGYKAPLHRYKLIYNNQAFASNVP